MKLTKAKGFYVTATDTGAGKTTVTRFLIHFLQKKGFDVIGCKPIACGIDKEGRNEDMRIYQACNSIRLAKELINPICLPLPVSPNIAAMDNNVVISVETLTKHLKTLLHLPVDVVFYEGVGGWKVPINKQETMIDVARALEVPILLVVGLKVGCLNHALLTFDSICQHHHQVIGWLGNVVDPATPLLEEHINTLQKKICVPYLGTLPYKANLNDPPSINLDVLIKDVISI